MLALAQAVTSRFLYFHRETKHWNNCSTSFCGSYSFVCNQASTLGPWGFINTDSSDVKSQDTKLFHPTVKLLQCAESKEETELNSYSCVQSTVFHMSTKDPNSWRRAGWIQEIWIQFVHFYGCFCHHFNLNDGHIINVLGMHVCTFMYIYIFWLLIFLLEPDSMRKEPALMAAGLLTASVSCGLSHRQCLRPPITRNNVFMLDGIVDAEALWESQPGLRWDEGLTDIWEEWSARDESLKSQAGFILVFLRLTIWTRRPAARRAFVWSSPPQRDLNVQKEKIPQSH